MAIAANIDSAPVTQRAISPKLRFSVLERDGFKCCYCGATPDRAELRVDHIYPVAQGGADHLDNLITACGPCNAGKSDRIMVPELVQAMQAKARERNKAVASKAKATHNWTAIPVVIDGVNYQSQTEAARALGLKVSQISAARRKRRLHLLLVKRDKSVTIRGVTYQDYKSAASALGVNLKAVYNAKSKGKLDTLGTGVDGSKAAFNYKAVTIRGVTYPSIKDAARALGVKPCNITNAKKKGYLDRVGMGSPACAHKPVTIRGVLYPSVVAASQALAVSQSAISAARSKEYLDRVGYGSGASLSLPIVFRGKRYPSINAASKETGISWNAVKRNATLLHRCETF